MDTTAFNSNFSEQGKKVSDQAADKLHNGLQNAHGLVDEAGDELSARTEAAQSSISSTLDKVKSKAKALGEQGSGAVADATQKARDTAGDVADKVISYTKEKPVSALLIAGVAGAVLLTLIQALTPSRD